MVKRLKSVRCLLCRMALFLLASFFAIVSSQCEWTVRDYNTGEFVTLNLDALQLSSIATLFYKKQDHIDCKFTQRRDIDNSRQRQ